MKKPPIELSLKQKIYLYAIIAFLIVTIGVNVGLLAYKNQHPSEFLIYVNDVDRYENGNTALRVGEFSTTIKIAMGQERKNCYSAIVEVDSNGKIVWEYTPKNPAQSHIDHEIKKREFKERMGYFYTDCLQDKIVFVDYQTQEITWDYWLGDINWTALNSSWDKKHYYNQPDILDWSHLNDIDFHNYSDWESMLLSIRDFNLIVEVNLTSAQNRTSAHEDDIIWWYGGDGILACPHNPDYLPNGNIIIVDSNNRRFIEVNMSSSEIVWEWNQSNIITWPRDCDLMPDGEHYLITDCDKTFILNKNTKQVGLRIDFGGYEADYIEDSNTITIGGDMAGKACEYDADTGRKVWEWGGGGIKVLVSYNLVIFILFQIYWVIAIYIGSNKRIWLKIFPLLVLIGCELFVLLGFELIITFFFVRTIC